MKKKVIVQHEVMYAETDMMGIVHHKNYIVWMEKGRIKLLQEAGIDIIEYEENGYYLPVVEVMSRYKYPAFYGDIVEIETYIEKIEKSLFTFKSIITCKGRVLNIGRVKCVVIGRDKKVVYDLPEKLTEALQSLLAEG